MKKLKMDMMKSKKTNPSRAKVLQSFVCAAQLIAKNDGNREPNQDDIIAAVKREVKLATQSKESGAPFNPDIFIIANEFLPTLMTEEELTDKINIIIASLIEDGQEKSPKMMGRIMGQLKKDYNGSFDGKMASNIVKGLL